MEMINLLNPGEINELKAARVNVRLRKFVILTFVTIGIIGGIYGVSFKRSSDDFNQAIVSSSNADKNLKDYATVKEGATEYQSNLAIAKKILGSEITFSTFVTDLAASLPANTVLDSLSLSTKSIGTTNGKPIEVNLTARAKGYSDVLALKTSLEKKTDLFSGVRIMSTTLANSTSGDKLSTTYPYTVTLGVVIAHQTGTNTK